MVLLLKRVLFYMKIHDFTKVTIHGKQRPLHLAFEKALHYYEPIFIGKRPLVFPDDMMVGSKSMSLFSVPGYTPSYQRFFLQERITGKYISQVILYSNVSEIEWCTKKAHARLYSIEQVDRIKRRFSQYSFDLTFVDPRTHQRILDKPVLQYNGCSVCPYYAYERCNHIDMTYDIRLQCNHEEKQDVYGTMVSIFLRDHVFNAMVKMDENYVYCGWAQSTEYPSIQGMIHLPYYSEVA